MSKETKAAVASVAELAGGFSVLLAVLVAMVAALSVAHVGGCGFYNAPAYFEGGAE